MNCKFCNAELPEEVTLCPECGKENLEEMEEVAEEMTEAEEIAEEAIAEDAEEVADEESEEADEEAETSAPVKTRLWVKILAAVGAVALLVVLAGAVLYGAGVIGGVKAKSYSVNDAKAPNVRDTVVATVGEKELTNSELQIFYWQAVSDFYNEYGFYMDSETLDMSAPFDEQYYDEENGITWQKFFLENGLNIWHRYAALCMKGKEEGYVLDAEMQDYLAGIPAELDAMAAEHGFEDAAQMLAEDMSLVCDEAGYMDFLETNVYATRYLDTFYDTLMPTMEEMEAYYKENEADLNLQGIYKDAGMTVDVRHILVCPKGGTEDDTGSVTYSDDEWETCRAAAQKILDQYLAGDKTEESFAQLATEYTEDPGSMSTGGLYSDVRVGQMVEPFENWCMDTSRKSGDTGLVQTTYGYHVMYYVTGDDAWAEDMRGRMLNERSLAFVDEAVAKWPMEVKDNKIAIGILPKAQ